LRQGAAAEGKRKHKSRRQGCEGGRVGGEWKKNTKTTFQRQSTVRTGGAIPRRWELPEGPDPRGDGGGSRNGKWPLLEARANAEGERGHMAEGMRQRKGREGGRKRGGGNRVGNWARSATLVREEEGGGSGGCEGAASLGGRAPGSGLIRKRTEVGDGGKVPGRPPLRGEPSQCTTGNARTRPHTMPQTECGNNRATRQTVAVGSAARERFQVSDVVGRKKGFVEKATEGKGGGEWMAYVAVAAVVESQTPDWPPPPDGRCAAGHSGKGHGTNQNPE